MSQRLQSWFHPVKQEDLRFHQAVTPVFKSLQRYGHFDIWHVRVCQYQVSQHKLWLPPPTHMPLNVTEMVSKVYWPILNASSDFRENCFLGNHALALNPHWSTNIIGRHLVITSTNRFVFSMNIPSA